MQLYIYRYIYFLFFTFTISLASLNEDQKHFIALHRPPLKETTILNAIFLKTNISEKLKEKKLTSEKLRAFLEQEGFSIIKAIMPYQPSNRHKAIKIIVTHSQLPEYIIKIHIPYYAKTTLEKKLSTNVSRIQGAVHLRDWLEKSNETDFMVPRKYLFHIPHQGDELINANYIVISEKLPLVSEKENKKLFKLISHETKNKILTIIHETGYHDASLKNLCFTTDKKIAFIDTEMKHGTWNSKKPFKPLSFFSKRLNVLRGTIKFYRNNPQFKPKSYSLKSIILRFKKNIK